MENYITYPNLIKSKYFHDNLGFTGNMYRLWADRMRRYRIESWHYKVLIRAYAIITWDMSQSFCVTGNKPPAFEGIVNSLYFILSSRKIYIVRHWNDISKLRVCIVPSRFQGFVCLFSKSLFYPCISFACLLGLSQASYTAVHAFNTL